MENNRVRIVDIADELGLSTATVSNVIHGKTQKISDETVKRVQQKLEELEQMVIDARFECTVPNGLTTTEYEHQLTGMLKLIRSIDEANES